MAKSLWINLGFWHLIGGNGQCVKPVDGLDWVEISVAAKKIRPVGNLVKIRDLYVHVLHMVYIYIYIDIYI